MVAILSFGFIAPVIAADNPGEKLTRGTANVLSCVLEVPKQIDIEWKASNNMAIGILTGLFKGVAYGIGRLVSGVYDIVTFPVNIPKGYESLVKPDFVFEE
jgi:putative exosortase-associated protein (TIGR04073 family)